MDFIYTISFEFEGKSVVRSGRGSLYYDGFNLPSIILDMVKEFGQPTTVSVELDFESTMLRLTDLSAPKQPAS